jgi:hypothetical protein
MVKQQLDVDSEIDLMIKYHRTIESKSVLIEHSVDDAFRYGLYNVVAPYPTYEEFREGNDFTEGELIRESSDIVQLEAIQSSRK